MPYEPVIGLEIHAELNTKTKMFCRSANDPDEKHPNMNICPICMGHPGTLPAINQEAVKKVIRVGLTLRGTVPEFSQFDRKNYFYPDLPKGYQISQYEHPFVKGGRLQIEARGIQKEVRITRVHLEEDTGRLVHDRASGASLVDFNRAGVPLMELVTEPDFRTGEEVRQFGEELQKIVRYVGASDADMEKGQMRVEVNISLRPVGQEKLGTKVEIKNINSFKYAADAVDYEIQRQTAILERGEKVAQETRGWDEHKGESFSQRSKEEAHDYRYFPEPDLPPLKLSRAFVDGLQAELPELPAAKRERFMREFGLERDTTEILVRDKGIAGYFEEAMSELAQVAGQTPDSPVKNLAKALASVMTGDFLRLLHETSADIAQIRVTPENLAELTFYVAENKLSNLTAKQVLDEMFRSGDDPSDIIDRLGLWQISDTGELEDMARHIIKEYPVAVEDWRAGKAASLQFLVGQVMKESRGKANPKIVQEIIKNILK
ncbi:MAG: Asp-tRNA(Asn)/Glu-tRNA(Gln) amidotransferase subunit GatB [Candidatus Sungbacteria bacterium]|uniref:Aspartyl/glutamyl-tRNA(Asn/Gln) amidotransferase subunit B n=1 Tax=Candidatus Sungiibacteriota bacterium TaxID=2750080 RepID=A0A932VQZ3_9BACT|nr:Asp-tRNA(Asn)/Glu-tRNA(Gln) amidotransferase subunit GatB [Candidatus Sungbacteria bacterium]